MNKLKNQNHYLLFINYFYPISSSLSYLPFLSFYLSYVSITKPFYNFQLLIKKIIEAYIEKKEKRLLLLKQKKGNYG